MKQIPLLIALLLTLSLCNITERFRSGNANQSNSGSGSSSSTGGGGGSAATGGEPVEHPEPTMAQTKALEGGQTVKWDQQGITWTLPAGWNKQNVETKMLTYGAPGNTAFLIASISPMGEDFPTDISTKAFYDGAVTRKKNGEVDELRYMEIDGVTGVQFREANPEKPDDIRRLQWIAYRKFAGQTQMVNLILSSNGKNFPGRQDELYAILYSTKLVH
ncbi:MAG TPA: hypothetical protein VGX92_02315 [Pyrinomonadaceae bacterium]|jgi:hypothetical protein|nr:hypothetical protein [Pyrinomonadaceae bacterium]